MVRLMPAIDPSKVLDCELIKIPPDVSDAPTAISASCACDVSEKDRPAMDESIWNRLNAPEAFELRTKREPLEPTESVVAVSGEPAALSFSIRSSRVS